MFASRFSSDKAPASGARRQGFDALLVAVPSPQAAPLLAASPGLAARAASVAMQPCIAVMVCFEAPLPVAFGGAFVSDSPLSWVARDAAKPGRASDECWVLHAGAAWSAQHLEDPPETCAERLLEAFGEALGAPLPPARHARVHRWRYAHSEKGLGEPFLWDAERGLGACGDWTQGGRIEGAFVSGRALAGAVLGLDEGKAS